MKASGHPYTTKQISYLLHPKARASVSNSVFQKFHQILVKLLKISHASNFPSFYQNGSCQILSPNLTFKISTPFYFILFYLILTPSSLLHFHLPLAFLSFFMPKPKILFSTPGSHWWNPRHPPLIPHSRVIHPRLPRQQWCRRVVHPERNRHHNPLLGNGAWIRPPDHPRR